MKKLNANITKSEKYIVLIFIILFYVLLIGVFMGLTYYLSHNIILLFLGKTISISLLVISTLIWIAYIFTFVFKYKVAYGIKKGRVELSFFWNILDEVCEKVDSFKIDEIELAPNTMIGIHDESGLWAFLGKSEKKFVLGFGTLSGITVEELKITLAHEFAHFSKKIDKTTVYLYTIVLALKTYSRNLNRSIFKYLLPAYYFMFIFNKLYPLIGSSFSKKCELLADKIASEIYGSETFKNALLNYAVESILFENNAYRNIEKMHKDNLVVKNIYKSYNQFVENTPKEQKDKLREILLKQKNSGKYDLYPTISERIALVEQYGYKNENFDHNVAISVFKHPNRLEKELTNYLNKIIFKLNSL